MTDKWSWSVGETVSRIVAGDVSAVELAEQALARISQVDPKLNALSEVTEAEALRAAKAVDAARAAGEPLGPLAGVPITTKNNVDQAGYLNTGGIRAAAENRATEDSPLVANLKTAGAVIVGRTNVPAFSFRWFTDSDLHGRTFNPHDPDLSPGGSSGGAGVAVAAGMGTLAHGNDIGGSIRFPALANGVAGLRPTVTRVPSYVASNGGMRALASQLHTADGPLARCVEDCRVATNVMAMPSSLDPQQVPMPAIAGNAPMPARIGLVVGSTLGQPAPEVTDALSRAASALEQAGCVIDDIELPGFEDAFRVWVGIVTQSIQHHFGETISACGDAALIHKMECIKEFAPPVAPEQVLDLYAQRLQLQRAWSQVFDKYPVILMPVSYRHALKVDADQGSPSDVERLFADQSPLLATALMGNPGLSVPTGLASDGAPTGVQLISRWWNEAALITVGRAIEAQMPAFRPATP